MTDAPLTLAEVVAELEAAAAKPANAGHAAIHSAYKHALALLRRVAPGEDIRHTRAVTVGSYQEGERTFEVECSCASGEDTRLLDALEAWMDRTHDLGVAALRREGPEVLVGSSSTHYWSPIARGETLRDALRQLPGAQGEKGGGEQ